jgi:hypothetical protein
MKKIILTLAALATIAGASVQTSTPAEAGYRYWDCWTVKVWVDDGYGYGHYEYIEKCGWKYKKSYKKSYKKFYNYGGY